MSSKPVLKPPKGRPETADDVLPHVVAPTAGFILQLFLIPMVIVMIIVMVWMMFSWLAHVGNDPKDLVADLQVLNEASWQKANSLSNLLRNSENDYLKDDSELAKRLAAVLQSELKAGSKERQRILLRVFLCRALGEFRVDDGLPVLLLAAQQYEDPAEMDVRYAALEGLSVLTKNLQDKDPQRVQGDSTVMDVLLDVSRERGDSDAASRFAELRSATAFALGVAGGEQALERLTTMLGDSQPNVRYNAATGLARHGDARAGMVLQEMLDPENSRIFQGEQSDSERLRKRMIVLMNGIRATRQLAEKMPAESEEQRALLDDLRQRLQTLADSNLPAAVSMEAAETLEVFGTP